jgi:hypothetical protein
MSNLKTLPGIKSISICEASKFKSERIGSKINPQCDFEELNLIDLAEFNLEPEIVSGQTIYTITGSFNLYENDLTDLNYLNETSFVFKITDIYGDEYIIGTEEQPYPILLVKHGTGTGPSGARKLTAELTYSHPEQLIPVF